MKTATETLTLLAATCALALFSADPAAATPCLHSSPGGTCVLTPLATPTVAKGTPTTAMAGSGPLRIWANHALSDGGIPSVGYDLATARTQFVKNMNYNFDPTVTWSRKIVLSLAGTTALTDVELARLTKQYAAEGGNIQTWVNLFIGYVGTGTQRRIAAATSDQIVLNGLARYGSAAMAAFLAAPPYRTIATASNPAGLTTIPRSYRMYKEMGLNPAASRTPSSVLPPPPNLDFTLYEIYLDYRTGALALSARGALYAAGGWTKICVSGSFAAGYAFGTDMLAIANTVDPGFQDWLNGEVGDAIDNYFMYSQLPSEPTWTDNCGCTVTVEWDEITYKD